MVTSTEDEVGVNRVVDDGAGLGTHVRNPPENLNAQALGAHGGQPAEALADGEDHFGGQDELRGHFHEKVRVSDVELQGHEAPQGLSYTWDCAGDSKIPRNEKANQDRRVGGAFNLNNAVHGLGGGLQPSRLRERVPGRRGDLEDRAGEAAWVGVGVVACRVRGRERAEGLGEEVLGASGQLAGGTALGARS